MEIDFNNRNEEGDCPHCGSQSFENDATDLSEGKWLNTCKDCRKQSIWFENKQYKIKE